MLARQLNIMDITRIKETCAHYVTSATCVRDKLLTTLYYSETSLDNAIKRLINALEELGYQRLAYNLLSDIPGKKNPLILIKQ